MRNHSNYLSHKSKILGLMLLSIVFLGCDKDDDVTPQLSPSARIALNPQEPVTGEEIQFEGNPTETSSEIESWTWDFGEGSTSSERNPVFTYEESGDYTVVLEVEDITGSSAKTTLDITVTNKEFPANIAWEFSNNTVVRNFNQGSAPAIADDGTIYYLEGIAEVSEESKVVAVRDEGETAGLIWATELPHISGNAPSIGPDGNVYVPSWGSGNGHVLSVNKTSGEILWKVDTNAGVNFSTAAIDSEGNLYHGSRSGSESGIFSWTTDGEKRWDIVGIGAFYSSPAISADEETVYYLNSDSGQVWAINAEDGSEKWDAPVGLDAGKYGSSLSIDADGTIYFTSHTHVAAITDEGETGSVKWQTEVEDANASGVVIGPDGNLYVGSGGGLVSLNPASGEIQWTYQAEILRSVPAVDVNGNIYAGTANGSLIIVNPDGELLKELELGDNMVNSPTIASDGSVFVEARDGDIIKLFKITVEESGPADSPWPMKGQNVKNTAQAK